SLGTYRRRADLRRGIGCRIVVLQTNNKQLDGFKKACLPHADQHSLVGVSRDEDASDERASRAFPDVDAIFPISGIPFVILWVLCRRDQPRGAADWPEFYATGLLLDVPLDLGGDARRGG
ncbi:MAG TPA: hypothetical protein VL157_15850, partial [Gemmatimonadaceae bacterium]|nr:hypothetical protein [Gemmatimonadaceae bacterium]